MNRRKAAISAYKKAAKPGSEPDSEDSQQPDADAAEGPDQRRPKPHQDTDAVPNASHESDPPASSANDSALEAERSPDGSRSAGSGPGDGFLKTDTGAEAGSGPRRSAALLLSLGPAQAADVLRHLDEAEVERVMQEVVALGRLDRDELQNLIKTGRADGVVEAPEVRGGLDVAREMLIATFGEEEGERIFFRSIPDAPAHHFAFVNDLEAVQLSSVLRDESPAAIAIVLAHIERPLAAAVLNGLDDDARASIVRRIGRMGELTREVVVRVEEALREKVRRQAEAVSEGVQGIDTLAAILREMNPSDGESILRDLRSDDVDLEGSIRKRLYTVDLLEQLSARDLSDLMRDFDDREIALFLKGKSEALRAMVLRSLSDRRAELVSDEYAHLGPQPREQVDEATQAVLDRLRRLEEDGAILVPREGDRYI